VTRDASLEQLVRHLEWADATLWEAVLGCEAATRDVRLEWLLHHIHSVQHAFLAVWSDAPLEVPEVTDFPDLAAVARWGRDGHAGVLSFLGKADAAELGRAVTVPWTDQVEAAWGRRIEQPTIEQTLVQVAMHSAHHRGQAMARLREVGGEPLLVDFVAWVWLGQPEAEWPPELG
jgi:uncharacterized damage-inducible protein DinB